MHPIFTPGTTLHNPVTQEWGRLLHLDDREMIAELICDPGGGVALMHRHRTQTERFDILAGTVTATLDGVVRTFGPGDTIVIEPGVPHNWIVGGERLHARVTVTPPGRFLDSIGAVWGLAVAGRTCPDGAPSPLDGILLAESFGDVMEPVSPPRWVQRLLVRTVAPILRATGRRIDDAGLLTAAIVDPARWPGATARDRAAA